MPRYGTTSRPLYGYTGNETDNQRASVFGAMPEHGHAYAMEIHAGYYDPGDPGTGQLAIYGTGGGNPSGPRLGRTATFNLNTRKQNASSGQTYNANLLNAVALTSGKRYALQALFHGGRMAHGQDSVASLMYRRSTSATNNPDPATYSSSNTQTRITISVLYEANVAPKTPTNLSPADGSTFATTTPTYAGDFRDDNEVLPNGLTSDYLNAYQIQVRSVDTENATTGTMVWQSGTVAASNTEKSNRRFSKSHPAGSPLTPGQRYQWRSRVQDRFGAWSLYTQWQDFLVTGAAVVTLDGNPTGRLTTEQLAPDFQGRYHHISDTSATDVQMRLYIGDVLIHTSPEIAKAVSSSALPGTLFTIDWADTAIPAVLVSGGQYSYQMRAKAAGVWSEWSAKRTFFGNGQPTTPVNIRPVSGSAVSSLPVQVTCQTSDPDGDALTVRLYLREDDGTPIDTLSMTYDPALYGGAGGYTVDLTSSELPTYAVYRGSIESDDADMISEMSGEIVFTYAQGPTVTVVAPDEDEVISTDTPVIAWTVGDQQKKRVRVWNAESGALVHDSGELVDMNNQYAVPPNLLRNNTDYYLSVEVTDSSPLTGTSALRNFRLSYTPPPTIANFIASPDIAEMDTAPSVIRLTWDISDADAAEFNYYAIYRRESGQPFADAIHLDVLPSQEQNTWVDTNAPAAIDLIYSIVQSVRESLWDIIQSDPADSEVTLQLNGPVISDVRDGLNARVSFDSIEERQEELIADQTEVNTWDGGSPWLFEGPTEYAEISMSARLTANDAATVNQQLDQLRALARFRADQSPALCCYRDERGRKLFGRVRDVVITDQRLMRANVEFRITELEYSDIPEAFG